MKVTATLRVMDDIDALRTSIVLAMERLCFASAESFADHVPPGDVVEASVAFAGPSAGAVTITMPPAALRAFAEAFLPDTPISLDDVACELANIVCGNVVPRIHGRRAVFALSLPRLARDDAPEVVRTVVHFDVGWVAATLHGAMP